eukprot:Nitzschia sp. Nitz4//scaffold393_size11853//7276//9227//NITZ4_009022-RA/size11853-snap-gene-0.15-mRNA-1//-1//CDS//3329550223//7573//frame0
MISNERTNGMSELVDDSSQPIEPPPMEANTSSFATMQTLQTQLSSASSGREAEARLRSSRMDKGGSRRVRATAPGAVNSQQSSGNFNETPEDIGAVRVAGMRSNRIDGAGTVVVGGTVSKNQSHDIAGSVTATAVSRDDLESDVRRQIMAETIVAEVVPVEKATKRPSKEEEPQRKSGSILLLAAVCLIIIGGAIVGVVVAVVGGKGDESPTDTNQPSPTPAPTTEVGFNEDISSVLLDFLSERVPTVTTPDSAQYRALIWVNTNGYTPLTPLLLETFALVTLYYSTDGPNWTNNDHWLDAEYSVCEWYPGDMCDAASSGQPPVGRKRHRRLEQSVDVIQVLDLTDNNLQGTMPPEIAFLTDLDWFVFHGNQGLTGTIPTEIGLLSNLGDFFAGETGLTGTLPTELGTLENLRTFHLQYATGIGGTIPEELWAADEIKNLYLEGIGLTGNLPEAHRSPHVVNLAYNNISGTIPMDDSREWGGQLEALDLSHNQLTGTIPEAVYRLWEDQLEVLRLEGNQFSGVVPEAVCSSFQPILDGLTTSEQEDFEFVVDCNGDDSPNIGGGIKYEPVG